MDSQDDDVSRWSCYCLVSASDRTYVGATVDLPHRLRQHNGELAGGARSTHREAGSWRVLHHVVGFSDKSKALSFEWHWKHRNRQLYRDARTSRPVDRRDDALRQTLARFPDQTLVVHAYAYDPESL